MTGKRPKPSIAGGIIWQICLTSSDAKAIWVSALEHAKRRSFDGAEFTTDSGVSSQKLQYFTPVVGAEYDNFMFAYTYSYQANSIDFNNGGYHQITLGFNFGCKKEKYDCNCPSVN